MGSTVKGRIPKDDDRAPVLGALSYLDQETIVPIYGDPANGALLVESVSGAGGGTSSNFGAAFPAAGTAIGATNGTDMEPLSIDGSGNLLVNVAAGGTAGTQYTDGGTPPTHPIGNASELNIGGTWYTETGTNVNGTTPSSNVFVMNATAGSPLGRVVLTDNNNSNQAEIKAASTAAGATDPALVVAISPNNSVAVTNTGTFAVQATDNITQIGGSTLTIGQQLAAASIPVILPSATITTLTQPTLQSGSTTAVTQGTAANLNATVVGTGTFAVQAALNAGSNIIGKVGIDQTTPGTTNGVSVTNTSLAAVGTTASGSSLTSNPVTVGGLAKTALPTAVSDGQVVNAMGDKFGRQVVHINGMRDLILPITQLTLTASTTETTLIGQTASVFNDILSLVVINTSATATQVDFRDSTGGTIRLSLYVPAGDTRGIALPNPLPQNTVNNNWTAKCGTSVSSVIITGTYITNK